MPINHDFVSSREDGPDTDQVQPSDWNAPHTTPTLAEVLAEGNEVASGTITQRAVDVAGPFAEALLSAGSDTAGFTLRADDGNTHVVVFGPNVGSGWSGVTLNIDGSDGNAGEALVSDPDAGVAHYGGVQSGAGAPSVAPDGFLPLYIDTGTDDLYVWDGAAWKGPYAL